MLKVIRVVLITDFLKVFTSSNTLGFVLPPKPILVTERMVIIPKEVRDGVSVFTIQKATWRKVDNEYNVVAVFDLTRL